MIIKKLTISNFRSYYGEKVFEFSKGLNLILGSNGDGKTTFFEALNWVLTPKDAPKDKDEINQEDTSLVSAKMFSRLQVGDRGKVCVSIEISYNQDRLTNNRIVERSFVVEKLSGDNMSIMERCHDAYLCAGGQKGRKLLTLREVLETGGAFPAVIKKYHLFKGEEKLNIFDDKDTLQNLIDLYSDVKDIVPYKGFAEFAKRTSEKAMAGSRHKADLQTRNVEKLNKEIVELGKKLESYEVQLSKAKESYNDADTKLDGLKKDMASIKRINELKEKEKQISRYLNAIQRRIDEDFGRHLLDEQWILMGFAPILEDFTRKMSSFLVSKENIEREYEKKQEAEQDKERTLKAKSELEKIVWKANDIEKMKYMLNTHRCAICGTEAPEGSVQYDFIKQRIHDVIELLNPQKMEKKIEIKKYFSRDNIEELAKMGEKLVDEESKNYVDIENIPSRIDERIAENNKLREEIASKSDILDKIRQKIQVLNASSASGMNLIDYANDIGTINRLIAQREDSGLERNRLLQVAIPKVKEEMQKKRDEMKKALKSSGADSLFSVYDFFSHLLDAIKNTEEATTDELLAKISNNANFFLSQLNVDDFTGLIRIYTREDKPMIDLEDKNGKIITNPNTSLLTTMHISILLAISELTKESRKNDYPLIFDAPTSSFDEGKDKSFYDCLNKMVDKQCIVVTKSFLYKNEATQDFEEDKEALSKLNCKKFRIRKLSDGFDKLDITTIDTQVTEITE